MQPRVLRSNTNNNCLRREGGGRKARRMVPECSRQASFSSVKPTDGWTILAINESKHRCRARPPCNVSALVTALSVRFCRWLMNKLWRSRLTTIVFSAQRLPPKPRLTSRHWLVWQGVVINNVLAARGQTLSSCPQSQCSNHSRQKHGWYLGGVVGGDVDVMVFSKPPSCKCWR